MFKKDLESALTVLKNGGVILYPTDTVWGLGCDATNPEAVERINTIKQRTADKSFIVLLDTDSKIQSYINDVPEVAYDLIEFAEHPLTVVFSNAKNLAPNVINADGSVGIRIVRQEFCKQLIQRFRKPLVSSSANISGNPTPESFADIDEEIMELVDYVVETGQLDNTKNKPSTIIKIGPGGEFSFIRK